MKLDFGKERLKIEYDWVVKNRPIILPDSYEEASERYIQDLKKIIQDKSQFKENRPTLMLSGGVDSMLLGGVLNKYFDFKDSITIGCVKDTDDIKVSQDTAEKLNINNKLIYCTWDEVIDNLNLIQGKPIKTVFDVVYYLTFFICLQKTNVKEIDLIQGDGADTLLGSHNTYPYMDRDRVAHRYNISKSEAKTRCKQLYYMNSTDPNKSFHKGSGHLFEIVAKELGANAVMAYKDDRIRWVNDLHYDFARPDKKTFPKKVIEYMGYNSDKVKRTVMQDGVGIYDKMKEHVCQITGKTHFNSAVKVLVNKGNGVLEI
jgi:asparagine synthetase B (glutamine-hydrolysing)|tara:strand:+ start:188 stop:1135 length:948 start_codon:yes stop_codon:yes gene_type:complete